MIRQRGELKPTIIHGRPHHDRRRPGLDAGAVSARLKCWPLLGGFLLKSANAFVGLVVTDRRDSALSRCRPLSRTQTLRQATTSPTRGMLADNGRRRQPRCTHPAFLLFCQTFELAPKRSQRSVIVDPGSCQADRRNQDDCKASRPRLKISVWRPVERPAMRNSASPVCCVFDFIPAF
jgi:hypothetical protein